MTSQHNAPDYHYQRGSFAPRVPSTERNTHDPAGGPAGPRPGRPTHAPAPFPVSDTAVSQADGDA